MNDDADIMMQVQAGAEDRFAILVNRYAPRLWRFARSKTGDEHFADDLVQETFLAAYKSRQSYSPEFAFSTWIWTIHLNLSRRQRERRNRQDCCLFDYALSAASRQTSSSAAPSMSPLLDLEEQQQLRDWFDQLSPPDAEAVRLRFYGELKFEEIALAMNSSLGAAKTRVKRGVLKLAQLREEAESQAE